MLELHSPFTNTRIASATLLDAWQWCYADLKSPTSRGNFAEYLVYLALCSDRTLAEHYKTRKDWDVVDLTYGRGVPDFSPDFKNHCHSTRFGWGIEVKSTSSGSKNVKFDLEPRQGYVWNNYISKPYGKAIEIYRRWSDFFILAHFKDDKQETQDIRDLNNWEFFVVPTWTIKQDSIRLSSLGKKYAAIHFSEVKAELDLLIEGDVGHLRRYKLTNDIAKKMYCSGHIELAQKMFCSRAAK
ncbi:MULTISPECIES: hypothetical protein [unclassified Pseudomonas]|uniref:hypothetical protein n=1 Tax=unclassified Pseudomonas TaxID=196821 RepID=UPI000A1FA9E5|nr:MULTISPECIES: hypothetical protein [unclassified Pseudomonas]